MSEYVDSIYSDAEKATGIDAERLRIMAVQIFASMLHHALVQKGQIIWTAAIITERKLSVEVNIPERKPARGGAKTFPRDA